MLKTENKNKKKWYNSYKYQESYSSAPNSNFAYLVTRKNFQQRVKLLISSHFEM